MLRAWFRTRRDLHTELAGVRDWNTELEDLNDENAALKQQLGREKARADSLAQRLNEMQAKSLALDRPFS